MRAMTTASAPATPSPPPRSIVLTAEEVRLLLAGPATVRRPIDLATLRVTLPRRVASEGVLFLAGVGAVARKGTYPATMNPYGAVCAVLEDGKGFGVKPGEFHFVCPWAEGETENISRATRSKVLRPWRITPLDGDAVVVGQEAWSSWEQTCVTDPPWEDGEGHTCSPHCRQVYVAYEATPRVGYRPVPDKARITYLDESTPLGRNSHLLGPWEPAEKLDAAHARIVRPLLAVTVERTETGWVWALELAGPERNVSL